MSQLGTPLDSEIVSWGSRLGSSLRKTSESRLAIGRGAPGTSTHLLAAFGRHDLKSTFLCVFLVVLSVLSSLPFDGPARSSASLPFSPSLFPFSFLSLLSLLRGIRLLPTAAQSVKVWGGLWAERVALWTQVHIHL